MVQIALYGLDVVTGADRALAQKLGLPTRYSRLALIAVSVFTLSHWRADVIGAKLYACSITAASTGGILLFNYCQEKSKSQ